MRVSIVWDDESPTYGYKSRTAAKGWSGRKSTPAVWRFYRTAREKAGEYRVNIIDWKQFILGLGDEDKLRYLTGKVTGLFNRQGWPLYANVTTSGNVLEGERVGRWFRFATLKPGDLLEAIAQHMTHDTHPQYIHRFAIVGWRKQGKSGVTVRKTVTPQGIVDYPLITNEGYAYIPWMCVKAMG